MASKRKAGLMLAKCDLLNNIFYTLEKILPGKMKARPRVSKKDAYSGEADSSGMFT